MFNILNYKPRWYTTLDELLHNHQLIQQLSKLRHQTIQAGIVMWDFFYEEHYTSAPFLLQLDHHQLEICCYKLDQLAITLDKIDRKIPLEILEVDGFGIFTYEWRNDTAFNEQFANATITGLSIEEYQFETKVLDDRKHPERIGESQSDLLLNGVRMETDKGDFSVFNALDETGVLFGERLAKEILQIGGKMKQTRIF